MLNLLQFNRNIRSIRRYRNVVRVLFKYGFDHILEYLNLSQLVARSRRLLRRDESGEGDPVPRRSAHGGSDRREPEFDGNQPHAALSRRR